MSLFYSVCPICYVVSEWVHVYKQLLFICYLFLSIPQVKVIQLTFSYYIFFAITVPYKIYDLYSIFFFTLIFFLKIFVYFIMLKISMSDVTFIWEIKDMASIQWMALTYAFVVIDKVELWYINVYIHHTYYWTGGHTGLQSSINSRTDIFQAFEKQMLLYWNSIQSGWLNFLSLKQQLCCWILFCIYMYV